MLQLLSNLPENENELLQFSLDEIVRLGAKRLLIHALNQEVDEYVNKHHHIVDDNGHRLIVKNGRGQKRKIITGAGNIEIQAPRVDDKRDSKKFTSKILPPYLRKSANIDSIIPVLYLKGLSGNAFQEALECLLGKESKGLSSSSISSLKKSWGREFDEWRSRSITDQYAYLWADGVNVKVRLGDEKKVCLLVVVGVNQQGEKHLFRKSEIGWKEVLTDLVKRGLRKPLLMIGDGGLGLWSALRQLEEFKETKEQRCWVHKIANVLDKLPKKLQEKGKDLLHDMMKSETKSDANDNLRKFKNIYESKYPKAYEALDKDWGKLMTFFDFPAENWISIRTTNPIESAFATIKLRTRSMKGAGSSKAAAVMAFKLLLEAEKKWRQIRGWRKIENLLQGALYEDGKMVDKVDAHQEVA